MPSNWVNWQSIAQANQPYAEKISGELAQEQASKEQAYQQALAKYRADATGNVQQGGSGQVASYGDAYAALKEAERNRELLSTAEGREAILGKKYGSSSWLSGALSGGPQGGDDSWKKLSGMLGDESFLSGEKADYARRQEQKAKMDAQVKQQTEAYNRSMKAQERYRNAKKRQDDMEGAKTGTGEYWKSLTNKWQKEAKPFSGVSALSGLKGEYEKDLSDAQKEYEAAQSEYKLYGGKY